MTTLVIDYGMGNLASVIRALEECGSDVIVSKDADDIEEANAIILPGVGAFSEGMQRLHDMGWGKALTKAVLEEKTPILGICLGMQLLADWGYEHNKTKGLGYIAGEVVKLELQNTRIPHIGWNEVSYKEENLLLENISNGTDFYFVHSYHFIPQNQEAILGTTTHGFEFVSIVQNNNIFGTQFHPEKSSKNGFVLLRNFLKFSESC